MYSDEDLLPLSALQHLIFCERQCALIHVEQMWSENRYTAEGQILHERAHEGTAESRRDIRTARGLRIRSLRLGLIGQADVVEFHLQPDGAWLPFPVEYKRGRRKPNRSDEVQLCAQALCLEEMLAVRSGEGAIFYGQPRRRCPVSFDEALRALTEETAARLHNLLDSGVTPSAVYGPKCDTCSLFALCQPKMQTGAGAVGRYLNRMVNE